MSLKILSITLFLIIFINFGNTSGFNVTLSCTPCKNASCPLQSCSLFKDDKEFSYQACIPCTVTKNQSFSIDLCQNTFLGTACPRGVCYSANTEKDYCGSTFGLNSCSETAVKVTSACGQCAIPCQSSQCLTTKFADVTYNACYNQNCSNFKNISFDLATCPNNKDYLGSICTCCINNPNVTVKIPMCVDYLDSDGTFAQYAKNRIAKESQTNSTNATTGNYENLFSYFSLLVLALSLLLIL